MALSRKISHYPTKIENHNLNFYLTGQRISTIIDNTRSVNKVFYSIIVCGHGKLLKVQAGMLANLNDLIYDHG